MLDLVERKPKCRSNPPIDLLEQLALPNRRRRLASSHCTTTVKRPLLAASQISD